MPEIITCQDCGKETYAGLPKCPHCHSIKENQKSSSKVDSVKPQKQTAHVLLTFFSFFLICHIVFVVYSNFGKDAGPWEGRIVDLDTSEPIEGAVVLAAWEKKTPNLHLYSYSFHRAIEVITDNKGYFKIPYYYPLNFFAGFSEIIGPKFYIHKPGYCYVNEGSSVFIKGSKIETQEITLLLSLGVSKTKYVISPNQIEVAKIPVISLKQKRRYIPYIPDDIPLNKMANLMIAINESAVSVGLEPYNIPKDNYLLSLTRDQMTYRKMPKVQQASSKQLKSAPGDIKSGKIIRSREGHGKGSSSE